MTKNQRLEIYNKFNGHCAYCGKEIEYKDMQVDHFIPQRRAKRGRNKLRVEELEDPRNLFCSCRRCNHYKRAHDIETFRRYIEEIPQKLANEYIYKVGADYGLVEYHPRKIKFYFEAIDESLENLCRNGILINLAEDKTEFQEEDISYSDILAFWEDKNDK